MNQTRFTDHDIRAAFLARSDGAPSAELLERIAAGARTTRQHRPIFRLPRFAHSSMASRLAWAAVLGAAVLALIGLLALGSGRLADLTSVPPPPNSVAPSASAPRPSASTTSPPSASPSGRTEVQFVDPESGTSVTITLDDESGRLVDAAAGEYGLIEPSGTEVDVVNLPGDATALRVEWPSPGGCERQLEMTIAADARTITVHTSIAAGGDSIGGFCGVTLRFSSAIPASEVTGALVNAPPN